MPESPFCFTHIVITAPYNDIAAVYDEVVMKLNRNFKGYGGCRFSCVADPEGVRIGSGGGTLNAIDHLVREIGYDNLTKSRVAIIHSGGDSRRAPLHSELSSPILLLIHELRAFCGNVPLGSVVVACSDVLLDINMSYAEPEIPKDSISVIVVPETPETAKNHGVVIEHPPVIQTSGSYKVSEAKCYLQKPSVDCMRSQGGVRFRNSNSSIGCPPLETVLVDTGVIIITGRALQRILSLLESPVVSRCTQAGLSRASTSNVVEQSARSSPRENVALRLELYSELLLPLLVNHSPCQLSEYYNRLGYSAEGPGVDMHDDASTLYAQSLQELWVALREVPLYAIAVEEGGFYHLGTSRELMDLVSSPVGQPGSVDGVSDGVVESIPDASKQKLKRFSTKYCLLGEVNCMSSSYSNNVDSSEAQLQGHGTSVTSLSNRIGRSGVVVNSYVGPDGVYLGRSFVEHSVLTGNYCIGRRSIASHIRGAVARDLVLQDDMMAQLIPLCPIAMERLADSLSTLLESSDSGLAVLFLLSSKDDVKLPFCSESRLCNINLSSLFQMTPVSPDHVWPISLPHTERTLWTAQIFEIFDIELGSPTLFILQSHGGNSADAPIELWNEWLSKRRLSMADLMSLGLGDARAMFHWRWALQARFSDGEARVDDDDERIMSLSQCFGWIQASVSDVVLTADLVADNRKHAPGLLLHLVLVLLTLCKAPSDPNNANVANEVEVELERSLRYWDHALLLYSTTPVITAVIRRWSTRIAQGFDMRKYPDDDGTSRSCRHSQVMDALAIDCGPDAVKTVLLGYVKFLSGVEDMPDEIVPRLLLLVAWLASHAQLAAITGLDVKVEKILTNGNVRNQDLFSLLEDELMTSLLVDGNLDGPDGLRDQLEGILQRVVRAHLQASLEANLGGIASLAASQDRSARQRIGVVSIARAPVRIDIAGGWSDTPPICYQAEGGAVLNVSVLVDGMHPIACASRVLPTQVLRLRSLIKKSAKSSYSDSQSSEFQIDTEETALPCSFSSPLDPHTPCSLIKACLVALKIVPTNRDAQPFSTILSGGCGLEVVSCSRLPAGSGMGGSSVLAAAVLLSLAALLTHDINDSTLVYLVSLVEQILTTGGGWQDQVGAIYGGFKIARSVGRLPVQVLVQSLPCRSSIVSVFNKRTCLVFTGTQRLAKNTLIRALRGFALSPVGGGVVAALVKGANEAASVLEYDHRHSVNTGDDDLAAHTVVDSLAATLSRYWELKKAMAEGSEPLHIRRLVRRLEPLCSGLSLCGAGAGGYAVLILKETCSFGDVIECVRDMVDTGYGPADMRAQTITVDANGIVVDIVNDDLALSTGLIEILLSFLDHNKR